MLSSGTLNLKFMQRNNNTNKTENLKPSININSSGTNSHDTPIDLPVNKGKRRVIDQSSHVDANSTPRWTIIYEESLIHFPFLHPASSSSLDTIMPIILGRQSFGESNIKSTQKPNQPSSQKKRTKLDSSTPQKTDKNSKKLKIEESQNGTKSPSDSIHEEASRDQTYTQENKRKKEKEIESNLNKTSRGSLFKKPFNSTTIKAKQNSTTSNKLTSPVKFTKAVDSNGSNTPQQCDSIIKKGDDNCEESEHSDDTELVKHQIEMMFKEARKVQTTSTR